MFNWLKPREKIALALTLIVAITFASVIGAVCVCSTQQSTVKEEPLPSPTPKVTDSPTPITTPSPTPVPPATVTAKACFDGPLGGFTVNYEVKARVLSLKGQIMWGANSTLLVTYTVDGTESSGIHIHVNPIGPHIWGVNISRLAVLPSFPWGTTR